VSPEALELLQHYDWPGNIRQLKNIVERMVLRAMSPFIAVSDLPIEVMRNSSVAPWEGVEDVEDAADVEDRFHRADRDRDEGPSSVQRTAPSGRGYEEGHDPTAPELVARMIHGGESFWSAVHEPFMHRNLTRGVLREVIDGGLEKTCGNYKLMLPLFNMAPGDYRKFVEFLRKFNCHPPTHTASAVLRFHAEPAHL
jgi:hypothetical protein